MKKVLVPILTLIINLTTSGCEREIKLNQYLNQDLPIIRLVNSEDENGFTISEIDTIQLDSESWDKILEFASNNQTGWNSTPASYNADYSLRQDGFTLLGWNKHNSVVISFKDEEGKQRQLTKQIVNGELDFLLN